MTDFSVQFCAHSIRAGYIRTGYYGYVDERRGRIIKAGDPINDKTIPEGARVVRGSTHESVQQALNAKCSPGMTRDQIISSIRYPNVQEKEDTGEDTGGVRITPSEPLNILSSVQQDAQRQVMDRLARGSNTPDKHPLEGYNALTQS